MPKISFILFNHNKIDVQITMQKKKENFNIVQQKCLKKATVNIVVESTTAYRHLKCPKETNFAYSTAKK